MSCSRKPRLTRSLIVTLATTLLLGACADGSETASDHSTSVAAGTADEGASTSEQARNNHGDESEGDHVATATCQPTPEDGTLDGVASEPRPNPRSWPLDPGTYGACLFGDTTTITVTGELHLVDLTEGAAIFKVDNTHDDVMVMLSSFGVVPPARAGAHVEHDADLESLVLDVPSDLTDYFASIDQVVVFDSGEGRTKDGSLYRWWDLRIDPDQGETFPCPLGENCIGMFAEQMMGVTVMDASLTARYVQVDTKPELIMWTQETTSDRTLADAIVTLADGLTIA